MSRKNLSRTVIEGGRYSHNKLQRRHSHGRERASTRAWLDGIAADGEQAELTAPPARLPIAKRFYDKLAPTRRWLASHVGRPWDKVYAELCATFDRRTVAGRHIVDDHMLKAVERGALASPIALYRRAYFYVDRHGILRRQRLMNARDDARAAHSCSRSRAAGVRRARRRGGGGSARSSSRPRRPRSTRASTTSRSARCRTPTSAASSPCPRTSSVASPCGGSYKSDVCLGPRAGSRSRSP